MVFAGSTVEVLKSGMLFLTVSDTLEIKAHYIYKGRTVTITEKKYHRACLEGATSTSFENKLNNSCFNTLICLIQLSFHSSLG